MVTHPAQSPLHEELFWAKKGFFIDMIGEVGWRLPPEHEIGCFRQRFNFRFQSPSKNCL